MTHEQRSFFFTHKKKSLLGVYYSSIPTKENADPCTTCTDNKDKPVVVFCNGFAGEHIICRPHLSHFARLLCMKGISSMRFDYCGYGDSEGDFEEATPTRMCTDIEGAIEEAKKRNAAAKVVLVGIRFGATLASLVAAKRDDICGLVLWEPIIDGWKYFFTELRQTVAMQTMLFREVKINRETIVENILANKPSLIDGYNLNVIDDGYPLGASFVEEIKAVHLLNNLDSIKCRSLILHLRERPGKPTKLINELAERLGPQATLDTVIEPTQMWKHGKVYMTHSPRVYSKTLEWLCDNEVMS